MRDADIGVLIVSSNVNSNGYATPVSFGEDLPFSLFSVLHSPKT